MSRWNVYEYMKEIYMWTGQIPHIQEVLNNFPQLETEEIEEGMREFFLAIQHQAS